MRSDGRPRHIRCYKMCSVDGGLWCWDATTAPARDDSPSQRRGWRGVLSFSFAVGVNQGRVSLSCKSLRGVHAPNRSSPVRSVRPEYSMSIIQSVHLFRALNRRGKNYPLCLPTDGKPFLCHSTSLGPGISGFSL